MKVDEAVKKAMKSKKITQMELASLLGTGQSNISMWLKSGLGIRMENLLRIANACGFDLVLMDQSNSSNCYVIGENDAVGADESFDDKVRKIIAEEMAKRDPTPDEQK